MLLVLLVLLMLVLVWVLPLGIVVMLWGAWLRLRVRL
jgi:hypothetical protein